MLKKIVAKGTKNIGFYLLHLPNDVIIREIERLKLKIPFKVVFFKLE